MIQTSRYSGGMTTVTSVNGEPRAADANGPVAAAAPFFQTPRHHEAGNRRGPGGGVERYATLDAARGAVRAMYANDRVLRVLIVNGDVPPCFVEWVER